MSEAAIASCHWDACETCKHYDETADQVCPHEPEVSVYLGDWIVCDNYERTEGDKQCPNPLTT